MMVYFQSNSLIHIQRKYAHASSKPLILGLSLMFKAAHYLNNILYSHNCFALFMFLNEYTLYLKGQMKLYYHWWMPPEEC